MPIIESKQIISSEKVYPSSPTPQNLQIYKISMLDQATAPEPIPLILCFPGNPKSSLDATFEARIRLLKQSLSVVLTRFYPLAGRISEDGQSIDCKDQGVPFIVAKIEGKMITDSMISRSNDHAQASDVSRLFPCEITFTSKFGPGDNMAMIQVNRFDCGGMAIGMALCHKIMDGTTLGNFVNSWAATARGSSTESVCPNYLVQSLFPKNEEMEIQERSILSVLKVGKSVVKRFVFDSSAINKLKEKSSVERPSRIEVVSAFIWMCFMVASLANNKPVSLVSHAVNLRKRSRPPFAPDCVGNLFAMAAASCTNGHEIELGNLVRKLRDAISKIDEDYVTRMLGDQGYLGYCKNLENTWGDIPKEADLLAFVSWCGFGLYKVDFGWGKPIWIDRGHSCGDSFFVNWVWLVETSNGDGIEAWVTLEDKYMEIFEKIEELQALASIDPNPLQID